MYFYSSFIFLLHFSGLSEFGFIFLGVWMRVGSNNISARYFLVLSANFLTEGYPLTSKVKKNIYILSWHINNIVKCSIEWPLGNFSCEFVREFYYMSLNGDTHYCFFYYGFEKDKTIFCQRNRKVRESRKAVLLNA